jgi:hypothetical protein
MSPGLVDYITRALVKPADQRSSLSDLMRHPWILGHARYVTVRMHMNMTVCMHTSLAGIHGSWAMHCTWDVTVRMHVNMISIHGSWVKHGAHLVYASSLLLECTAY